MMNKKSIIKYISLLLIVIGSGLFSAGFQSQIISVAAQLHPIMFVAPAEMRFGVVFPQEKLDAEFVVVAKYSYPEKIYYAITQKPKPIWPELQECQQEFEDIWQAREYCQDYPEDYNCCYPSLCPYLEKISEENEGDVYNYATLNPIDGEDLVDYWLVNFDVPTIKGYVGQDFEGIPVEIAGDYGCDINVEFIEEPGPGPQPECTDNDGDEYFVEGGVCGDIDCDDDDYYVNPGVSEVCDNNIDDDCDGDIDSNDTEDCPSGAPGPLTVISGGGGGGGPTGLVIFYEEAEEVSNNSVLITWFTNKKSTSRVIFDTDFGAFDINSSPNYGYDFSTLEYDTPANPNGVTYHQVVITGLSPGTNYYYRCVSHASPDKFGKELSFTTSADEEGEGEGEAEVPEGEIEESGPEVGPAEEPAEDEGLVIGPAEGEEEEEVGEEEKEGEEEEAEEEIGLGEEEPTQPGFVGNLLAGIGGFASGLGGWWIILIIIILLLILLIAIRRRKREE